MTEFLKAGTQDREEIVDFINYVFSYSHRPHDFKTLLPKVYKDGADSGAADHFVAKENGKIKAVVALRVVPVMTAGKELLLGQIGSVSVHPYSRGAGYMKELLSRALSYARDIGVDLLVLSGQRQRYGYFGFENAGVRLLYRVTKDNIRHCLKDTESGDVTFRSVDDVPEDELSAWQALYEKQPCFIKRSRAEWRDVMHNWHCDSQGIYRNGAFLGYCYNGMNEVVLKNEEDYPAVLKALLAYRQQDEADIPVFPFEKQRRKFLTDICEDYTIRFAKKIRILHWGTVLEAYLNAKSLYAPNEDGSLALCIDGEEMCLTVQDGKAKVQKGINGAVPLTLSGNEAEKLFFGLDNLLFPQEQVKNWTPLPFLIRTADEF
ncbi:MAG: GNAT family N-acetyltransferase [Clostridia bacterium]|nr:GNAT family N-acetyltransferase [Clostridia bacterium]